MQGVLRLEGRLSGVEGDETAACKENKNTVKVSGAMCKNNRVIDRFSSCSSSNICLAILHWKEGGVVSWLNECQHEKKKGEAPWGEMHDGPHGSHVAGDNVALGIQGGPSVLCCKNIY